MNYTEEFLAHYGVPGMRWGIRHTREYLRGQRKQRGYRLVNKASKKRAKANRLQEKARNTRYGITDTGRTIWENRQLKAGKAARKAEKAEKKAARWIAKHSEEFNNIRVNDLKR